MSSRDFTAQLEPYAWLWWTAANLYNPLVRFVQLNAHLLKPHRSSIRAAWAVWNGCLALFSFFGFWNTCRVYVAMLCSFSSLCAVDSPASVLIWDTYFAKPAGNWFLYFIVSKLVELGDSLFLAALGKPILFLHWYHHLATLACMYIGGLFWHPYIISGVTWNYCVHTVMYAYYACSCFGYKWPKPLAQGLTTLQITQFLVNLASLVASIRICGLNFHITILPTTAMYAVYTCMFVDMFMQKYTRGHKYVQHTTADGADGCVATVELKDTTHKE